MKTFLNLVAINFLLILFYSSCDPDKKNIFETDFVKLKGDLNKTDESIMLGDTLKFTLTLPSVITGTYQSVSVTSLQEAYYLYRLFRIDTLGRRTFSFDSTRLKFFINPGIDMCQGCGTGQAWLQKNSLPFTCTLNIVPEIRGVFYIQIGTQAGRIKANNNYEAGLLVNFNVTDKHLVMLDSYLGNGFLTGAIELDQEGFGFYGFRVK